MTEPTPPKPGLEERIREWWDEDAAVYDRSASHSGADPVERAAWRAILTRWLPESGAAVLDVGAGTGAMTMLLAELGYRVTALDLAEQMLEKARAKAEDAGHDIEFVVSTASEPPAGPFDAIVERHMLWTLPEPLEAISAWRRVMAREGRLLVFEGLWEGGDPLNRAAGKLATGFRRMRGVEHDHHAEYDPEIRQSLPLADLQSPAPLLDVVKQAGWRNIRLERLRDVEWARRMASGPVLGRLETRAQFAVIADA